MGPHMQPHQHHAGLVPLKDNEEFDSMRAMTPHGCTLESKTQDNDDIQHHSTCTALHGNQ